MMNARSNGATATHRSRWMRLSFARRDSGGFRTAEPDKRPRVTLSPTLLFHRDHPVMATSVAGGDQQDQAAIQVILDYVDFNMSPEEAFHAPRFSTEHLVGSFSHLATSVTALH